MVQMRANQPETAVRRLLSLLCAHLFHAYLFYSSSTYTVLYTSLCVQGDSSGGCISVSVGSSPPHSAVRGSYQPQHVYAPGASSSREPQGHAERIPTE